MGESVAEGAVTLALQTLRDLVIEEAKFLRGVKGQAEQLQQELGHIRWLLKRAEERNIDKEMIKEWVMEFKDIVYDAEDVLESYAFKIGSRRKRRWRSLRWLNLNELQLKHQVGLEIQNLITKVSNLKEGFEKYGVRALMEAGGSNSSSLRQLQQLRRSYSNVLESDFVDLGNDIETLVLHLVEDNYKAVSIYGMGGLGKTTLAQKVYNHPRVKNHFGASVWLCISQEWNTLDILQSILIKLFPERRDEVKKLEVDELVRELNKAQTDTKIIFVLDDIWEAAAWESMKHAFNGKHTKILLTTRKEDVARAICPNGFHYQPPLLDHEQSWELLQKKSLLQSKKDRGIEEFEVLGLEMVKHCGGLPLAIIVLGGILATKDSRDEWKNIHDNIEYFLGSKARNDDHHSLDDILSLSYDDLPHRLKPCFLYMAAYAEDESIDAELLYHMWMAEGLVSMEDRKGEDEVLINVAERYLGELVQRCMVQLEVQSFKQRFRAPDIHIPIKFKWCRLHDIMRDLCVKKARDDNFLLRIDDDKQRLVENVSRIRRLVMTIDNEKAVKPDYRWPLPDGMEKTTRSLQLRFKNESKHGTVPLVKARIKGYKLLKVLTMDGLYLYDHQASMKTTKLCGYWDVFELQKHLLELSHLRFLKLTDHTECTKVPLAVIGKLEHLQILDLRDLSTYVISKALLDMRELRYLYLPKEISSVLKLSTQDVLRLHSLHKLEVLENFDLSYCNANDLSQLTNLVQLHAKVSSTGAEQLSDVLAVFVNSMSYLNHLKHLSLEIELNEDNCTAISVLKLSGLSIDQHDCIETLEKLPNLQKLVIDKCKGAKEITFHSNGFPQLKWLEIIDIIDLEKWNVDEGAMPNLLQLYIEKCLKLEMIPDGLRSVTSLKYLFLEDIVKEFHERLFRQEYDLQEGTEYWKISQIPFVWINSDFASTRYIDRSMWLKERVCI